MAGLPAVIGLLCRAGWIRLSRPAGFPAWPAPARGAILQPPRPEIPPSPRILQRVTDHDADWEAAV
jgi:hypothetical protein